MSWISPTMYSQLTCQQMISAADPRVALASVMIAVLLVAVTTMTTTVAVEEVAAVTRLATMTAMLASVTTALVTAVTITEVLVVLIVTLAVKTDMAAVVVPVATTGTAAVAVMTVVLSVSLSLTVTVLARTLLAGSHPPMRLLVHPKAAGIMVVTRMIVSATGDRARVTTESFANQSQYRTNWGSFNTCHLVL